MLLDRLRHLPLLLAGLGACCPPAAMGTSGGTGLGGSNTSGTGGACAQPPGYDGGTDLTVDSVTAMIVDGSGTAIDGDIVFACGINLCQPGSTDASGSVDLNVNLSLLKPMFLFGDALTYVKLAAPITQATASFSTLTDPALPVTGVAFAPGSAITSGPVTLTLAAGTQVAIDTLNYSTADQQEFRAVQVPTSNHQQDAIPGIAANNLVLVFGVAPLETTFCPSAMVTVPNSPSWPASSAVQFLVFDVDTLQQWTPYGDWHQIAQGQVSADGTTISTAPGEGFPVLDTFGIRLAL